MKIEHTLNLTPKLYIDPRAKQIINILIENGFDAYVVGGCVRDSLLGREPKDWDICTNATPEQTMEVFKGHRIVPTGLAHGTVTILIDDEGFEVTTYRIDGEYSDGRRPDDVQFTSSITEDLARRDFTINAMAYNHVTGLVDPFFGFNYLVDETISCVGDPNKRFQEDGLRIMRAIRFVSQLGFTMDLDTANAIYTNRHLLNKVSRERVRDELTKILTSDSPSKGLELMQGLHVMELVIPELPADIRKLEINNLSKDTELRLAGLLLDLNKSKQPQNDFNSLNEVVAALDTKTQPNGHQSVLSQIKGSLNVEEQSQIQLVMQRLRFSNQEITDTSQLIDYIHTNLRPEKSFILGMLNKIGESQLRKLIELQKVTKHVDLEQFENLLNELDLENECYTIKHLEVSGNDLIELGMKPGKLIGETLQTLLERVIEGKIENTKEQLLAELRKV